MLRTAIRALMLLSFAPAASAMGLADAPPQSTPPLSELPPTPAVPANGGAHPLSLWLDLPDPASGHSPADPGGPSGLPDLDLPHDLGVPLGPPDSLPPAGGLPPFELPPDLGVPPGPPGALLPPHFPTPPQDRPMVLTPEPTTGVLVGLGLIGLARGYRHRRRRAAQDGLRC